MMISPENFRFECEGKPYEELLRIRGELLEEVRSFESGDIPEKERLRCPSPEVVYQMELEYLGELFRLISDTYNRETVWGGHDGEEEEEDDE